MHSWVAYRSSMGWTANSVWTTCIVWQAKKYKLKLNYPNSHDHPSIFYHLFRSGSQSQQPKQRYPDLPQPSYLLQLFRWSKSQSHPAKGRNLSRMSSVCPAISFQLNMLETPCSLKSKDPNWMLKPPQLVPFLYLGAMALLKPSPF